MNSDWEKTATHTKFSTPSCHLTGSTDVIFGKYWLLYRIEGSLNQNNSNIFSCFIVIIAIVASHCWKLGKKKEGEIMPIKNRYPNVSWAKDKVQHIFFMGFKYLVVYHWVHNHPEEVAVPQRRTGELKFIERMINWKWQSHKKREMLFTGCVNESIGCCKQKEGLDSTSITNLRRVNLGVKCVIFFWTEGSNCNKWEGNEGKKYKIWEMSNVEPRVSGAQEKQSWRVTKYKAQQRAFLCLLGTLQEIVKTGGFLSRMEIYSGKEAAWAENRRFLVVQIYDFRTCSRE